MTESVLCICRKPSDRDNWNEYYVRERSSPHAYNMISSRKSKCTIRYYKVTGGLKKLAINCTSLIETDLENSRESGSCPVITPCFASSRSKSWPMIPDWQHAVIFALSTHKIWFCGQNNYKVNAIIPKIFQEFPEFQKYLNSNFIHACSLIYNAWYICGHLSSCNAAKDNAFFLRVKNFGVAAQIVHLNSSNANISKHSPYFFVALFFFFLRKWLFPRISFVWYMNNFFQCVII